VVAVFLMSTAQVKTKGVQQPEPAAGMEPPLAE